jgi:hypothetical protein
VNCRAQSPVRDVALGQSGSLVGAVTDDQGVPQSHRLVTLLRNHRRVAVTKTNGSGVYRLEHMAGGVYVVVVDNHANVFRAWAPGTAPPAAMNQLNLALASGDPAPIVRGQYEWGDTMALYDLMERNPLLTAGVIATLIAVPVAVIAHNQDSGDAS